MNMGLDHPEHQSEHNKIVKKILRELAEDSGESFQKFFTLFTQGDEKLAVMFWDRLWQRPGMEKKYNEVSFCPDCRLFDLDYDPQGLTRKDLKKAMKNLFR